MKITHVPIIKGESYLLLKFIEDCERFGYKGVNKERNDAGSLTLNGNSWNNILELQSSFKELWLHPIKENPSYSALKEKLIPLHFDITVQYSEALKFMEENMLKWEEKFIQQYEIY